MKKLLLTTGAMLALALSVPATVVNWYSGTVGTDIADNSVAGTTFNTTGGTWSSPASGVINSVSVLLNISGGYNGDIYGYLVYNDGVNPVTQVLLNRAGGGAGAVGGVAGFGGGATTDFASLQTAGVTLADGAGNNIQNTAAAAGQSYTAAGGSLNDTFGGRNTGATWTLFLADLAGGDQSTLVSWGLSLDIRAGLKNQNETIFMRVCGA